MPIPITGGKIEVETNNFRGAESKI